jgi:hypothetical protein
MKRNHQNGKRCDYRRHRCGSPIPDFLVADGEHNNFGRDNPMRWAQKRQHGTAPLRLGNVRQRNLPGFSDENTFVQTDAIRKGPPILRGYIVGICCTEAT